MHVFLARNEAGQHTEHIKQSYYARYDVSAHVAWLGTFLLSVKWPASTRFHCPRIQKASTMCSLYREQLHGGYKTLQAHRY